MDEGYSGDCNIKSEKVTVIRPRSGWRIIDATELWRYRGLLFFLAWRDIKIRYKQSLLGVLWAVIQPAMYMVVFTIIFGKETKEMPAGIPYPLFSFSALILWTFFSVGIAQAGNSLLMSAPLVTKVYVPRLSIPFASIGSALFDFIVAYTVLLLVMVFYIMFSTENTSGVMVGPVMLMTFPILFLTILLAIGVGSMLAALNVAYRDFKYTIPFLVQLWMFSTPAIYMSSTHSSADTTPSPVVVRQNDKLEEGAATQNALVSTAGENQTSSVDSPGMGFWQWARTSLQLNPMNGLVASFRAALLGHPIPWQQLGYSTTVVVLWFSLGCMYFYRLEPKFADII